ncbi:MAG: hypothetical protein JWR19_4112 [Pedosphaera sp.]|nr:hypothetical protein [Pedosphaera sp.]
MLDWDALCKQSEDQTDLSENERRAAIEAFANLKRIFAGKFFDINHPLYYFFINRAPWTKQWAVWFCKVLQSLEAHPDFQALIADLESPLRHGERMTVLSMVERLLRAGFTVRFDPAVPVKGIQKKPDLLVQLASNTPGFFIEISGLHPSSKQREAHDVARQFFNALTPDMFGGCYSGRIERILAPMHLAEVLDDVRATVKSARENAIMQTLEVENVVHVAVGPASAENEIRVWAAQRGMKPNELTGPAYSVPELDRLAGKLRDKQEQLPSGMPNVIVLHPHIFSANPGTFEHFKEIVESFEEQVYRYPQVAFVALVFEGMMFNPNPLHKLRDHFCINRRRMDFVCDATILMKNRFANPPMAPDLEARFLDAFLGGI